MKFMFQVRLQADGGIYFSTDAGMNWKRIDSKNLNLPSHRVWALAFDPVNSNRIFAGDTFFGRLYY